jgi:phosphoribosylformimino-5-aminoimidazole carboxamide ribotide isomerase
MKLFPALDCMNGKIVRLRQGSRSAITEYPEKPLDFALRMQDNGFTHLHFVDLEGAFQGTFMQWKVLELLCTKTKLIIDASGGIRSIQDIQTILNSGARQISAGSIAAQKPALFKEWLHIFGPERIILSADIRNRTIAVQGWQQNTSVSYMEFLEQNIQIGVIYAACTDISRDGMLGGINTKLYADIQEKFPQLHLIASGGVAQLPDLEQAAASGLYGCILGKAIHENLLDLSILKNNIQNGEIYAS